MVYCEDCKWYTLPDFGSEKCLAPGNRETYTTPGDYCSKPYSGVVYKDSPRKLNQYNACPFFEAGERVVLTGEYHP